MRWIRISSCLTFDQALRLRTTRISSLLSVTSIYRDSKLGKIWFSSQSEDPRLKEFVDYLESLKNYEKLGVPEGAGTDSDDGFDLGRMRRLLQSLGNPHLEFKAVHIAGTKGKGSTAQFISNILRKQGYIVLTALAFRLFAQQKVDIAVVEVVIGGPFLPQIEQILREKATIMSSPLVSACDSGKKSILKGFFTEDGRIYQLCNIFIECPDMHMFSELLDVKLQMLGRHQLQNAITAACTALLLGNQGWEISGESIHAGLEDAFLLGRSQFLSNKEAELLEISGTSIVIDGGVRPDIVVFTETSIAGARSRAMNVSSLKEIWMQVAKKLEIDFQDLGIIKHKDQLPCNISKNGLCFVGCESESVKVPITLASALLRSRVRDDHGIIIVTGSLHIVGAVLGCLDY